jgi:hypothetical protein
MLSKGDAALITVVGCTRIAAKVAVYAEIRAYLAIQGMPRRASWNALTGSLILLHLIRLIKDYKSMGSLAAAGHTPQSLSACRNHPCGLSLC